MEEIKCWSWGLLDFWAIFNLSVYLQQGAGQIDERQKWEVCNMDGRREHYTGGAVLGAITIRLLAVNVGREKFWGWQEISDQEASRSQDLLCMFREAFKNLYLFTESVRIRGEGGTPQIRKPQIR